MQKLLLSFLLLITLLFCFSQDQPTANPAALKKAWEAADKLYHQAERQVKLAGDNAVLKAKTDNAYRQALAAFAQLKPAIDKAGVDSLAFFTCLRTAAIEYYLDSMEAARADYLSAIALQKKLPAVTDSFLFLPSLRTGIIYYGEKQFDSALHFYRRAEAINDQWKEPLNGSRQLYERLGFMYYETGEYRKAGSYFEKAITLTNPTDKELLVNYKTYLASILVKLEEYPEARSMYESLVPYNIFPDELFYNLGIVSLEQGDHKNAIGYLRKVNYTDSKKNIGLYYHFARAYA
jgi:tetratricopeptide (TPR) repeat protein